MARKKKKNIQVGDLIIFVGSGPTPSNLKEAKEKGIGLVLEKDIHSYSMWVLWQGLGAVKPENATCVEKYIHE